MNLSKETHADTLFRLKFKRVIEKEFRVQEFGEQHVEVWSKGRAGERVCVT